MYEGRIARRPRKFFEQADLPLAKKLARCFRQLQEIPTRDKNIRPLTGPLAGLW